MARENKSRDLAKFCIMQSESPAVTPAAVTEDDVI